MLDRERLIRKAESYGVLLDREQLELFVLYTSLLIEWNKVMNLTAITLPEEIENKHIIDSILLAIQPDVQGKLVDVGSGAGLPGLACKIIKPQIELTLMEPTQKRIKFLEKCRKELGIDYTLLAERAEDAGKSKHRQRYNVATARAVAALPQLCEYCLPLVREGGVFLAMKGEAAAELRQAENAIKILGGSEPLLKKYTLPDGSQRTIIEIAKEKPTPSGYPRHGGTIKKKPL